MTPLHDQIFVIFLLFLLYILDTQLFNSLGVSSYH